MVAVPIAFRVIHGLLSAEANTAANHHEDLVNEPDAEHHQKLFAEKVASMQPAGESAKRVLSFEAPSTTAPPAPSSPSAPEPHKVASATADGDARSNPGNTWLKPSREVQVTRTASTPPTPSPSSTLSTQVTSAAVVEPSSKTSFLESLPVKMIAEKAEETIQRIHEAMGSMIGTVGKETTKLAARAEAARAEVASEETKQRIREAVDGMVSTVGKETTKLAAQAEAVRTEAASTIGKETTKLAAQAEAVRAEAAAKDWLEKPRERLQLAKDFGAHVSRKVTEFVHKAVSKDSPQE